MSKSKMKHASDLGISFSAYKIVFDRGYGEAIEDYGWSNEKDTNYGDHKRPGLFSGNGIEYIRMRADKHEKIYNTPKQAKHLRKLANELEAKIQEEK